MPALLEEIRADGLTLTTTGDGRLSVSGPAAAREKWTDIFRANKAELIAALPIAPQSLDLRPPRIVFATAPNIGEGVIVGAQPHFEFPPLMETKHTEGGLTSIYYQAELALLRGKTPETLQRYHAARIALFSVWERAAQGAWIAERDIKNKAGEVTTQGLSSLINREIREDAIGVLLYLCRAQVAVCWTKDATLYRLRVNENQINEGNE